MKIKTNEEKMQHNDKKNKLIQNQFQEKNIVLIGATYFLILDTLAKIIFF